MPTLPDPPPLHDLTWRPWTLDDADALARHMLRVDAAERLESVSGTELYRWLLGQDGFDPATDSLAGFDASGEVRAEVKVWAPRTDAGARAFIWLDAAPPATDLRPFLIAWGEARSRQILEAIDPALERVIRVGAEEHRTELRAQIEAAGFPPARSWVVMRRALSPLPPAPALPEGVRIEPWSAAFEEAARLASNEAFADHWGSQPMTPEMWQGIYRNSEVFRPDLSFLAVAGDEVVALCLAEVSEENNVNRGSAEVYIDRVGTRRSHRRSGIASHLVVRTLAAAASTGLEVAALDVDETSHTQATTVYRRLGFEVTERSITYVKTVDRADRPEG